MTLAYADFIAGFPEFTNTAQYPQAQFNFWLPMAYDNLNGRRFRTAAPLGGTLTQLDLAACLFIAHNLALSAKATRDAAFGKVVGEVTGALTAKSVDKVAASYNPTTTIEGAGPWNATLYGQRLYQMMQGVSTAMYVPGPRRALGFGSQFGRRW